MPTELKHRQMLRLPAVERLTGLSKSGIYQGMKEGWFPRAVKLASRSVGWLDSEIAEWVEERERYDGGE